MSENVCVCVWCVCERELWCVVAVVLFLFCSGVFGFVSRLMLGVLGCVFFFLGGGVILGGEVVVVVGGGGAGVVVGSQEKHEGHEVLFVSK